MTNNFIPKHDVFVFGIDDRIEHYRKLSISGNRSIVNLSDFDSIYVQAYSPFMSMDVNKVYMAYRQCYAPHGTIFDAFPTDYDEVISVIENHKAFLKGVKLDEILELPWQDDLNDSANTYCLVMIGQNTYQLNSRDYSDGPSVYDLMSLTIDIKNPIAFRDIWVAYLYKLDYIAKHTNHESALEHMQFTFRIDSMSRACSHQNVRHRIASFSQQSQKFTDEKNHDYIIPPSIADNEKARAIYIAHMEDTLRTDNKLKELGIPREDCRYVYPNGFATSIVESFNVRSLYNFFIHRSCNRAQWEIRAYSDMLLLKLRKYIPIIFDKAGPKCLSTGCPERSQTCGHIRKDLIIDKD